MAPYDVASNMSQALISGYYASGGDVQGAAAAEELQVENKAFFCDVGENPRGRFLKVSERGGPATRSLLIGGGRCRLTF